MFELEFAGLAYRGNGQCGRAVRGGQPKAVRAQRVKMRAAGHQRDLMPVVE